uniref:Uncharacterized protein n=1 Tax=Opuntia streptacantha TaxID=393608 RepID=A0A7C9D6E3_OPUST
MADDVAAAIGHRRGCSGHDDRVRARVRVLVEMLIVIIKFNRSTMIHRNITPNFSRNLKSGLIMRTFENKLLTRAHFAKNSPILLLQPPKLLDQLILVEIQLKLGLDLVIKRRRVKMMSRRRRTTGGRVLQKPL